LATNDLEQIRKALNIRLDTGFVYSVFPEDEQACIAARKI
jgi:hypothetical protein